MIIAVDAGSRDTAAAEHVLHELLGPAPTPVIACTHMITGGETPHLAVSITAPTGELEDHVRAWCTDHGAGSAFTHPGATAPDLAGPSNLVRGAYVAAVETALGAGRLVRWPGREHAYGVQTAANLRSKAGIDYVEALGGLPITDDTVIDTRDFVRPLRREGQVILQVQPAAGGVLIPFEAEHQQKCCADH
jgi:hypothetical protein